MNGITCVLCKNETIEVYELTYYTCAPLSLLHKAIHELF